MESRFSLFRLYNVAVLEQQQRRAHQQNLKHRCSGGSELGER